jgi:hypothetical protein
MTYVIIIIKMRNNNSFIRKKTNNFTQKHYFNQKYLSKQRDLVFIKKNLNLAISLKTRELKD